jgi:glycosyltransferase involved in cell wall biosynthesis
MKLMPVVTMSRDWLNNFISSKIEEPGSLVQFVTESADWVIKQVGKDLITQLNGQKLLKAKVTTTHKGIHNQIIHFGSRNLFLLDTWKNVDVSNKLVFTWFHGTEEDKSPANLAMIKALPEASKKADVVHTSCTISKDNLVRWNVPQDKIVVVPLGVDLKLFKPLSKERKYSIRKELGLPQDKVIIGSFQKDGEGWGEGLNPKWIKGPDIFVNVIDELSKQYDIFVLLLGPSRGFVKKELNKIGVPYRHFFLKDYVEIPKYYNALDLYLVTSRAEGGPKAVLESLATGVPLVTTQVGMVADVIQGGINGLVAGIDDVPKLAEEAGRIIGNSQLGRQLVKSGLSTVLDYSWVLRRDIRQAYRK